MARRITIILPVVFALNANIVFAHPGHRGELGISHFVTDPYHVVIGLAILGACAAATWCVQALRKRSIHASPPPTSANHAAAQEFNVPLRQ